MFLGLDCSTQSISALLINTETGTIEHSASVRYQDELPEYNTTHGFVRGAKPDEFFSSPAMWLDALDLLFSKLVKNKWPLERVKGISGAAQQHSTIYLKKSVHSALSNLNPQQSLAEQLDDHFSRPVSPIWLDASTNTECQEIIDQIGGNQKLIERTGSSVTPRFSAAQIRKYAKQYPERWYETDKIHLVSSFLNTVITGQSGAIDYGDGAGMNLMELELFRWDEQITNAVFPDLLGKLPPLQASSNMSGLISPYFAHKYGVNSRARCFNWSGDNPSSLVGMGASSPGKWVISLGTSYTIFCATKQPIKDPLGFGNVFGNPIDGYMSLSCFKNGALACFALKDHLAIDWETFNNEALRLPTADSFPALPFFETEITPRHAAVDQSNTSARAFLDGQFLNMKHHSKWMGQAPDSILVTGGVSISEGVCQSVSNIFQVPVHKLKCSNSAALGASIRAATSSGHSLQELEHKFCNPCVTVTPQSGSAVIYAAQLDNFKKRLSGQTVSS